MTDLKNQILVLGSGIAGLSSALKCAEHAKVIIISKVDALEGATRYAQGGIASVWSEQDSFQEHIQDTLIAGDGLCHLDAVEICVEEGPKSVRRLIELGVPFTKSYEDGKTDFDLHREGGHGKRRILHADDLTGLAIEKTLLEKARSHPNIQIFEHHVVIDLITQGKIKRKKGRSHEKCLGAYVLDSLTNKIKVFTAQFTILATGGAGKVYRYTTNPDTSTGDGIALAFRAGAKVANLEFFQFHPTCLFHSDSKNFLISEALRGEGARLLTQRGESFMEKYHAMGSLAPRDRVARAIDMELKKSGDTHVLLDATSIPASECVKKFPNIYQKCLSLGIDMNREPIPVVPAAHYLCGGVLVNNFGETSVDGLYALGEVSCTGLHGANRLASNSLLEAVVYAERVCQSISKKLETIQGKADESQFEIPEWDSGKAVPIEEKLDIASNWSEIRTLMWNYVGIVRSNRRLERAKRRLDLIRDEINRYYWEYLLTKDLIELRNILIVAELIVKSAQLRKESRGLHFTVDYPEKDDLFYKKDTVF